MRRVGITAMLVLAACGAGINTQPDGGDGPDASGGGLSLAFSIDPAVPGQVVPGLTIDSVDLAIKDLRLTGDAASASDDRTRAAYLAISWKQDHQPFPATFPKAPPGLYSKIAFKLENDLGDAFKIKGTVFWENQLHPFVVESENGADVSVPMDVTLPAGGTASDTLQVHMIGVLANVDWSHAQLDSDGTLQLEGDTDVSDVRNHLVAAFTAASTAPH